MVDLTRRRRAGTLANTDAQLLICPGATLDVARLLQEIAEYGTAAGRLFTDPQAMIIEEADVAAEKELIGGIGSTGMGGGAAAARRIMGRHRADPPVRLARDIPELAAYISRPPKSWARPIAATSTSCSRAPRAPPSRRFMASTRM